MSRSASLSRMNDVSTPAPPSTRSDDSCRLPSSLSTVERLTCPDPATLTSIPLSARAAIFFPSCSAVVKTRVFALSCSCRTRASNGDFQFRIHNHPQGVASSDEAAGEFRVILHDGTRAHEDGLVKAPQAMCKDTGRLRADPPGMPCGGGDLPVDGLGEFQRDIGDPGPDVLEEDLVDLPALIFEHAHAGFDSVPLERCNSPTRDERVGVDGSDDDPGRFFSTSRSTQGGVFPWCEQGSRLM